MSFIESKLKNAKKAEPNQEEHALITVLLDYLENLPYPDTWNEAQVNSFRRQGLAAIFDLLVAATYYGEVHDTNWLHCPQIENDHLYYYTYTNTCPRSVLKGDFYFHACHKPSSGTIGAATRRLLVILMQELLRRKEHKVEVYTASEPVDALFVDYSTTPTLVLFAEVKSAPLLTPALATKSQQTYIGSEVPHVSIDDHVSLSESEIYIFIPTWDDDVKEWKNTYFPIGRRESAKDIDWAFTGIRKLIMSEPNFFKLYIDYWIRSFAAYASKNKTDPIFWFTNGCGQPPSGKKLKYWKQRANGGSESVSDGKSSVGMDRTDDIKKSVYQALKLGVEGKHAEGYNYRVGIVSNIHAVRHFEGYFDAIKDLVWTYSDDKRVKTAGDLWRVQKEAT